MWSGSALRDLYRLVQGDRDGRGSRREPSPAGELPAGSSRSPRGKLLTVLESSKSPVSQTQSLTRTRFGQKQENETERDLIFVLFLPQTSCISLTVVLCEPCVLNTRFIYHL